jgi:hypothetical protein
VRAIDRLRGWSADIPAAAYSWAVLALSGPEVMELLGLVDGLEQRVAELEAAAVALPNRCADCGRGSRNLFALQDGDRVVYLGPQCLQMRRRGIRRGQAQLPIGGAR